VSIKSGLLKARGSLVFIFGLTIAFGTVFALEQWQPQPGTVAVTTAAKIEPLDEADIAPIERRELTSEELRFAKIAWQYFETNTDPHTGLVNSVDQYPASTLWDTSSYLLGLIAAERLQIVPRGEFNRRMAAALNTLAQLPLFDSQLPNKSYSTRDGAMVTYNNVATERGIGWSAIDVGRVLVPFHVLVWHYPEFTSSVMKALSHWDLAALVDNAQMIGATVNGEGHTRYLQEGRLGYEEYAAKSLALTGMDLSFALDYEAYLHYTEVNGVRVGTDVRTPDRFDALNMVVSEPYVLDGLEFGWDRHSRSLSHAVYRAQEARFERTGTLTAVSEDHIDQAPHFVYNTVYAAGKPWNTLTEDGEDASAFRSVSTKAVFGMHALYNTPYTQRLMEAVKSNYDKDRGWYSGIYEVSGKPNTAITANTNGIVLEALHYVKFGPMLQLSPLRSASAQ
jgi:hypothetical protein